jgi:hypothetical protein
MGANAVTTVPVYTAGEVLTAANMNITNSGIPVFATTVTRDAAFGGTGEKTLAEGQFAYIEATNTTQYYDGAAWQSVGQTPGLVLVKTQTIGTTVASVEVTGAFSSTYDNYQITISGGVASTAVNLGLQLGATTTGYYAAYPRVKYSDATANNVNDNNAALFSRAGVGSSNSLQSNFFLLSPNFTKNTVFQTWYNDLDTASSGGSGSGFLNNSTAYTAFTIIPNTGTLTGGTIRVYGYANS